MYNDKILSIFENPSHVGIIKCASGVGEAGNVDEGQLVKIYINVENDAIIDAKFKAYGNMLTIVGASALCSMVKNMPIDKAKLITTEDVLSFLNYSTDDASEIEICVDAFISSLTEYYSSQIM